jgi:hypothetical protein
MSVSKINTFKTREELEIYRNEINEAIDKRIEFINLCNIADDASKQSFGYIKEAFENISPILFKTSEGKKIIKKYTKIIKETGNLQRMHTLYENIRKMNKESDIDFFISKLTNENWGVTKSIEEDTQKMGRILAEGILMVGESAKNLLPNTNNTLDNAIKYISENKLTVKNIAEYSDAMKIIRENVNSNEYKKNVFETTNLDSYVNNLLENFNKKFDNELTEEEKIAIKEINNSSDKEGVFNRYKGECITKLTEAMENCKNISDDTSFKRINTVLEKVKNKNFVIENINTDICGFMDLTKLFK